MKFTCTQENLNRGLVKALGVTTQATSLPILKNIFVDVKEGLFKLKSTDLEIGVTTEVRGKVEEPGQITVDAKIFTSFVSLLPQDKVTLATDGKSLTIKGGTHRTKISGLSAEDYPVIPEAEKRHGFKVSVDVIKKALAQVMPAVSPDDTRPEINGVYFIVNQTDLTLVGTDSYRLSEKKVKLLANDQYEGSFIVPLKTVKEFVRTIDETDETVDIFVQENQVGMVYGLTEMVSRLVEGDYPDYKQIIPSSHRFKFTLAREDFLKAVKISGLFAGSEGHSIILELKPEKGLLTISSATAIGEEQSTINVTMEGDADLKIIFDYRYLLDGIQMIDNPEITFLAGSESSPAVIKSVDEAEALVYIVMPIRQ